MKQELDLANGPLAPSLLPSTDLQPVEQPLGLQSLFGAFPELALFSDEDFRWAKHLWNQSLDKQEPIIAGEIV